MTPQLSPSFRLLRLIFFASGMGGLIYQVLWVRMLSLVFGVTTYAMAAVLSAFMGGLALGSALAARLEHRASAPLEVFAFLELTTGITALLMPGAITAISVLHHGWLPESASLALTTSVQFLEVGLLLLIPTTCMGATLPMVSKYAARARARVGEDVGLLYALNTLGATLGTLLAGFWAIEHLGIQRSNAVAASVNFAVAATAWWLARHSQSTDSTAGEAVFEAQPRARGWAPGFTLSISALIGFTSIAYEVIWTRLLEQLVLTTTYIYTIILATVIGGIGLGSLIGAKLADRSERPEAAFGKIELGLALSVLAVFPLLRTFLDHVQLPLEERGDGPAMLMLRIAILAFVLAGPASLCMGATFPFLTRVMARAADSAARPVGRLYSANTLGGILGAIAAGFILLPSLGIFASLLTLSLINFAVGLYAGWPRGRRTWSECLVFGGLILCAIGASGQAGKVGLEDIFAARLPPGSKILALREGRVSTVMVADHSQPAVRRIWINSAWVAGSGGAHKMLGHLPLLLARNTDSILGIAFGTGQSFGTAALYPIERLDCVDLNPDVVELGGVLFSEQNHGLIKSPLAHVHIRDGRDYVARSSRRFDVIIMEPLQPWSAGAVNLYSHEFYESLRRVLQPGGVVAQWMPIDDVTPAVTRSVVATLAASFPYTYVFLDNYDLWLVGSSERPEPLIGERSERLKIPEVRKDLESIDYPDVESVLATCILGPKELASFVADAPLISDDRPFLEFVAPRMMTRRHLKENLEALRKHIAFPLELWNSGREPTPSASRKNSAPTSLGNDSIPSALRDGSMARALLDGLLATEEGRTAEARQTYQNAYRAAPTVGRLRAFFRATTARLASKQMKRDQSELALQTYRSHLALDPDFGGGWLNLGLIYAHGGEFAAATAAWERAEADESVAPQVARARAWLNTLRAGDDR